MSEPEIRVTPTKYMYAYFMENKLILLDGPGVFLDTKLDARIERPGGVGWATSRQVGSGTGPSARYRVQGDRSGGLV